MTGEIFTGRFGKAADNIEWLSGGQEVCRTSCHAEYQDCGQRGRLPVVALETHSTYFERYGGMNRNREGEMTHSIMVDGDIHAYQMTLANMAA